MLARQKLIAGASMANKPSPAPASPWDTTGPSTIAKQLKRGPNVKPAPNAFGDGGTMRWLDPKRFYVFSKAKAKAK